MIERLAKKEIEGEKVLIIHRDPGRYTYFIPSYPKPIYIIGRSMFETNK